MQKIALLTAGALALGLAACAPEANEPEAAKPADSMENMSTPVAPQAAAGPITGTGTVAAVNVEAGTIRLDHGPIPALNWSAMTMEFKADPAALSGIAVGDSVSFEIKSASESSTLAKVQKQ